MHFFSLNYLWFNWESTSFPSINPFAKISFCSNIFPFHWGRFSFREDVILSFVSLSHSVPSLTSADWVEKPSKPHLELRMTCSSCNIGFFSSILFSRDATYILSHCIFKDLTADTKSCFSVYSPYFLVFQGSTLAIAAQVLFCSALQYSYWSIFVLRELGEINELIRKK
jgi:hypothetical protein